MTRRATDHTWADHNTLVGFTEKRGGRGYHFYATETNSYAGGVPVEEIDRRLLNWTAVEAPLTATSSHFPDPVLIEGKKVLLASDNGEVLGIHGNDRPTRQYRETLIDSVSTLLDVPDADLGIGSVGFLDGRKKMWINIELNETLEVPNTGVEISPFMLAATSHDASVAWTFKMLNELIVCGNMVSPILRGHRKAQATHKIRNTRYSRLNVEQARANLGILHQNTEEFMAEIEELVATTVTAPQFSRFMDLAAPLKADGEENSKRAVTMAENKRDAMEDLWNHSPMVSPWKGTAFGLFQMVNTFQHHLQGTRNGTRVERNLDRAVRDASRAGSVETNDATTMQWIERVLQPA